MTIIEQLAADRAAQEAREKANPRRHFGLSDLQRLFTVLRDQVMAHGWSRDDLIQLVDLALAEAAALRAEKERFEVEEEGGGR
jgi:hypothetical protein